MSRASPASTTLLRTLDRRRRSGELPVVLCVDVEPDARVFGRKAAEPWRGFERFVSRVPALREALAAATGAPAAFTWLLRMDPQVAETWGSPDWPAAAYGDALAELGAAGDELGLHTHTWRWDERADGWLADYEDEVWAEHCLAMGLEAFEAAFRRPCRAHRGGDHFLCGSMLARLREAGVKADLTVEPGWPPAGPPHGEPAAGALPDYRSVPRTPYRSSPELFPAAAGEGGDPLLIPLLSPPALRRRHRLPLPPDSRHFAPRLAFELLSGAPPVLAMVLRSDASLRSWDLVRRNLDHLARHRGVRFLTASAAAESLVETPPVFESPHIGG
jgi:hypothetical protein